MSPSQIRNRITAGLASIVDPPPSTKKKQRVREYFRSSCAYCGKNLADGEYDYDHAHPFPSQGTNSIYNHVLSCKECNQREKKDLDWETFLRRKIDPQADPSTFRRRHDRIADWVGREETPSEAELAKRRDVKGLIARLTPEVDRAIEEARAIRDRDK